MNWKGKELETLGDLLNDGVLKCDTKEEAMLFMANYSTENEYAAANIGYLAGYCDTKTADRIYEWFDVSHPAFGKTHPTMEEAFNAGVQIGQAIKDKNS